MSEKAWILTGHCVGSIRNGIYDERVGWTIEGLLLLLNSE